MSAVGQKKSENKLTRGRKKKTTKVNESLEDFEDKKDTFAKKTDASSKLSLIFDNELQIGFSSTRIDDESGSGCGSASFLPGRKDQLPPCPLCGKVFQEGQELQRSSHLKSCGSSLGLTTEKLLQVKRLEEKQVNEWKELNLPSTSNFTKIKEKSKASAKPRTRAVQTKPDANLEIALALSASLAHSGNKTGASLKNDVPEIILSQATVWPIAYDKTSDSKSKNRRTILQTRTEAERLRQVSEVAEVILSSVTDMPKSWSVKIQSPNSRILKKWFDKKTSLWKAAENKFLKDNYVDVIKPFMDSKFKPPVSLSSKKELSFLPKKSSIECRPSKVNLKRDKQELPQTFNEDPFNLSRDWETLFDRGEQCDLTIYGREEEAVPCHTIVMLARCRKVLDEVIIEHDAHGVKKLIAWHDYSLSAIKMFIRYLYCGKAPTELKNQTELNDLKELSKKYKIEKLLQFVKLFDNEELPEEGEEEHQIEMTQGGFVDQLPDANDNDESQIDVPAENVTQNLNFLIDAILDKNSESECDEWEEVCNYLTQKQETKEVEEESNVSEMANNSFTPKRSTCSLAEILSQGQKLSASGASGNNTKQWMGDTSFKSSPSYSPPLNSSTNSFKRSSFKSETRRSARSDSPDMFADNDDDDFTHAEHHDESPKETENIIRSSHNFDQIERRSSPENILPVEDGRSSKRKSGEVSYSRKKSRLSPSVLHSDASYSPFELPTPTPLPEFDEGSSPWRFNHDNSSVRKSLLDDFDKELNQCEEKKVVTKNCDSPMKQFSQRVNNIKELHRSPMPDYESMLSPALKKELRKFGLKAIPRRKAIPVLKHIFQETHPVPIVEDTESCSQSLSQNSEDDCKDFPEETLIEDQLSSQAPCNPEDLATEVIKFIKHDPSLNRACLMFEPIWLEDFFTDFKKSYAGKVTLAQVTDVLDSECITFRTRARQKNNRRSPKKY